MKIISIDVLKELGRTSHKKKRFLFCKIQKPIEIRYVNACFYHIVLDNKMQSIFLLCLSLVHLIKKLNKCIKQRAPHSETLCFITIFFQNRYSFLSGIQNLTSVIQIIPHIQPLIHSYFPLPEAQVLRWSLL